VLPGWRIPITGTAACCACATTGHAAALPSPAMNVRRFVCRERSMVRGDGDVSVRLSALYGTVSALEWRCPRREARTDWRTKRRVNRRVECADKRNPAICYVQGILYHLSV
jgi:hypothetical protein